MSRATVIRESVPGGTVARLTYDRAAKANALDRAAIAALTAQVRALAEDADLRAVVITGAGGRAFIGGADLGELGGLTEETARSFISDLHALLRAIAAIPVPTIARVDGWCLGAGMELAAVCDIRIASEAAHFGMPEVRVGIPSVIEAALLPRLVGWGRASWLVLTGEAIDARTAWDWGFLEKLVPADRLDAAVDETVRAIAAAGPEAVRAQKRLLRQWEILPLDAAYAASIDAFAASYRGDEPARMVAAIRAARSRE